MYRIKLCQSPTIIKSCSKSQHLHIFQKFLFQEDVNRTAGGIEAVAHPPSRTTVSNSSKKLNFDKQTWYKILQLSGKLKPNQYMMTKLIIAWFTSTKDHISVYLLQKRINFEDQKDVFL